MNARRYLHLLLVVFGLVLAPQLASCQVPTLWSKCQAAAFNNFVISWRAVEEEIVGASKHEIEEFVTWSPKLAAIRGDDEDIFLFIWARLDDRGQVNIRDLESKKLPWPDNGSPAFIKLRMTQDHDLLLRFFRSIESDGHPDPFDFGVIRCLGLVPVQYIDETISELRKYCRETSPELRKYCDPSSQKREATGIYAEEMAEIQDMLEYRKMEASPASSKRR
ncbi:MAG: hypothetical protein ACLQDI_24595 [Syntrophobacteraceae bacterium]